MSQRSLRDYRVRIVNSPNVLPSFDIQPDRDEPVVTYIYTGDVAELVLMAQEAGEFIGRRRQIPLIKSTESDV